MSYIEIQKKEKVEKWPWTSDFLKGKRTELKFSDAQYDEVARRAMAKFSDIAKESKEAYSEEVRKKWEKKVEDEFLKEIIDDVAKRPYWISGQSVVNGIFSSARSDKEREEEELRKKRAAEQMASATFVDNVAANSDKKSSSEVKSDKPEAVAVVASPVAVAPALASAEAEKSDVAKKQVSIANDKLTKEQVKGLFRKFRSYGLPGLIGGTMSKIRDITDKARFAFDQENKIVSNVNDNGMVTLTFNGNCASRHLVAVSNNCYVAVDYDSRTGAVSIINDALVHKNGDKFSVIDTKKSGDLALAVGGERDAQKVMEKLKNLKIIACSNPKPIDGVMPEDQPKRQVAALVDAKTSGSRLTTMQKFGLALGFVVVGGGAVVSGGLFIGAAALVTALGTAASAAVGAGSTAASAAVGTGGAVVASATSVTKGAVGSVSGVVANGVVPHGGESAISEFVTSKSSDVVHFVNNIGNSSVVADKIDSVANDVVSKVESGADKVTNAFNNSIDKVTSHFRHGNTDPIQGGAIDPTPTPGPIDPPPIPTPVKPGNPGIITVPTDPTQPMFSR